jgi:hypothetical protein
MVRNIILPTIPPVTIIWTTQATCQLQCWTLKQRVGTLSALQDAGLLLLQNSISSVPGLIPQTSRASSDSRSTCFAMPAAAGCRKRIKAIRQALEKKGWATTGY